MYLTDVVCVSVADFDTVLNAQQPNLTFQPLIVRSPVPKPVGFVGNTKFDSFNTDIGMGQVKLGSWTQPE